VSEGWDPVNLRQSPALPFGIVLRPLCFVGVEQAPARDDSGREAPGDLPLLRPCCLDAIGRGSHAHFMQKRLPTVYESPFPRARASAMRYSFREVSWRTALHHIGYSS